MKRHFSNKLGVSLLAAGALSIVSQANATPIVGSISFYGNVTPHDTTSGLSPVSTGFNTAGALFFGNTQVAAGANGSFAGVAANTPVTMYSPLVINPPALPIPATHPLWSVTTAGSTFNFVLSVLTEPFVSQNILVLSGVGTISDSNAGDGLDDNTGTWIATFTSAASGTGVTFSWNSSSAFTVNVPESGASFLFMGIALAGMGVFSHFRKQVSAAC